MPAKSAAAWRLRQAQTTGTKHLAGCDLPAKGEQAACVQGMAQKGAAPVPAATHRDEHELRGVCGGQAARGLCGPAQAAGRCAGGGIAGVRGCSSRGQGDKKGFGRAKRCGRRLRRKQVVRAGISDFIPSSFLGGPLVTLPLVPSTAHQRKRHPPAAAQLAQRRTAWRRGSTYSAHKGRR